MRYVAAYHDRETADILLAREKQRGINTGLNVHPFKFIDEGV